MLAEFQCESMTPRVPTLGTGRGGVRLSLSRGRRTDETIRGFLSSSCSESRVLHRVYVSVPWVSVGVCVSTPGG